MRLWHVDLIPYIPNTQLIAQWRELNSIFKKQDDHILINYIYDYPKEYLWIYTCKVVDEMDRRRYKIKKWNNYDDYFTGFLCAYDNLRFDQHNNEYLTICYYNLKEKYMRGQKDFTKEIWDKLDKFYKERIND